MKTTLVSTLRRYLERQVRRILEDDYAVEVDVDTPLKYYLDFKSDPRLRELQDALDRMEHGKFGVCLSCGGPIEIHLLKSSPGIPFCSGCLGTMHFHVATEHRHEHLSRREELTHDFPSTKG